jgi:hypothetical protein
MNSRYIIFFLILLCGVIFTDHGGLAEEKRVRAKIGIEILSGQKIIQARSREMLKPGDLIRIYVHSSESTNVYVVYAGGKNARLLNMTMQKIGESTLCLPSAHAYYKVDGSNHMERFTIVCSPKELPQISDMEDAGISWNRWAVIEEDLLKKSKIELRQSPKPIIEIAGNVRGSNDAGSLDQFVDNLPVYSGKGLLVKTYEFKIQNQE